MTRKVIKKTIDHLADMAVSIGAEFLDKEIDYEYKSQDGLSIVSFKEKKDICDVIRLRILIGKKKEYGDIVDELIIKKVGSKGKIKRYFVKPDHVKSNLEEFHKKNWKHYKKVKKFTIKEYIKKLYKGFRFEDKKREGSKALKRFLKEIAILIEKIANTLGLPEEEEDFSEEMAEFEKEDAEGGEEQTPEQVDMEVGEEGTQALETRKPSRLRSIVKKIAFTVATVALTAIAAPVAGAVIMGGARAIQGAKMAQSSLQGLRAASSPFRVVKTVVKKVVTEAGKQVIGDHQ